MTERAIVIAHRGASGYLPEHTLVGKALAYGLGADYLEQDVIATRDAELVVLHDLYLDDVSDDLGSGLRLIQLVGSEPEYAELLTTAGLARVAGYAFGLGPKHTQLVADEGGRPRVTPLTTRAHELGLQLHPYTFRREELPRYAATLEQLLEIFLVQARVDGVFCDFPDVAARVRDSIGR